MCKLRQKVCFESDPKPCFPLLAKRFYPKVQSEEDERSVGQETAAQRFRPRRTSGSKCPWNIGLLILRIAHEPLKLRLMEPSGEQ